MSGCYTSIRQGIWLSLLWTWTCGPAGQWHCWCVCQGTLLHAPLRHGMLYAVIFLLFSLHGSRMHFYAGVTAPSGSERSWLHGQLLAMTHTLCDVSSVWQRKMEVHLQGILDDILNSNHCSMSNILALVRASDLPSKADLGCFLISLTQKHPHSDFICTGRWQWWQK